MYTKKYIDIITLIIVTIIFVLINIYQFKNQSNIEKILEQESIEVIEEVTKDTDNKIIEETNVINKIGATEEKNFIIEDDVPVVAVEVIPLEDGKYPDEWYIKIPKIDLVAQIEQGTSDEILNKAVGHFEESSLINGNVCLAAHNRGYSVNYFEKIKNLLINDIIIYQYGNIQKIYSVSNITIINEDDWSYIENSKENKITLITCVEDEPEYRLCVQAEEII